MPDSIERTVASIKEDHRADYLFDTKAAARAVGCHPNKFHDWWYRSRRKLIELYIVQPGQTAAELLGVIALAEAERQRRHDEQEQQARRRGAPGP